MLLLAFTHKRYSHVCNCAVNGYAVACDSESVISKSGSRRSTSISVEVGRAGSSAVSLFPALVWSLTGVILRILLSSRYFWMKGSMYIFQMFDDLRTRLI